VTRDEFDAARDAATAADIAYRGGLTNSPTRMPQRPGTPSAPTRGHRSTNGHQPTSRQHCKQQAYRYDEVADARLIDQADRFD